MLPVVAVVMAIGTLITQPSVGILQSGVANYVAMVTTTKLAMYYLYCSPLT